MQIVLAACFLMLTQLSATASLRDWVDKYPSNDTREYRNFFELDSVKKPVKGMLTPRQWKLLTKIYSVMTPIELVENHLVVRVCKPHCCPCDHAMLVFDLKNSEF